MRIILWQHTAEITDRITTLTNAELPITRPVKGNSAFIQLNYLIRIRSKNTVEGIISIIHPGHGLTRALSVRRQH